MDKKIILLKILGLILVFLPFFINFYSINRLLSVLIGLIVLVISLLKNKKRTYLKIIIYPIILCVILYIIDYAFVFYYNRIPIFADEIKSNDTVSTYDSLFYRVYNCNNLKVLDIFYKQNYVCEDTLEIKDINSFLNNIEINYKEYHSKFVTIKGKISEIVGNDYITLQTYDQDTNLVGKLNFNSIPYLKIENNNDNLEFYGKYEIYDNIIVTGRIVKKDNDVIIMHDAKITLVNNFDDFTLNIIESKNCKNEIKELTTYGDYNYYTNCIDDIYVLYDEDTIYDMIFTLETKKMTLDKLIKDANKEEDSDKELYITSDYNILKCKFSNNILIGNSSLKLTNKFCENFSSE